MKSGGGSGTGAGTIADSTTEDWRLARSKRPVLTKSLEPRVSSSRKEALTSWPRRGTSKTVEAKERVLVPLPLQHVASRSFVPVSSRQLGVPVTHSVSVNDH